MVVVTPTGASTGIVVLDGPVSQFKVGGQEFFIDFLNFFAGLFDQTFTLFNRIIQFGIGRSNLFEPVRRVGEWLALAFKVTLVLSVVALAID